MGWLSQQLMAGTLAGWKRLKAAGLDVLRYGFPELSFFLFLFLFLWLVVEPRLIFHGSDRITNFPSFYGTRAFFLSHLSYPGGPVEYVSAFLSQLFYWSWLGALVVAIQAWVLGCLAAHLVKAMGLARLRVIVCVPALLMLVLCGRYTHFFLTTTALLCALSLACLHVRLAAGRAPIARATSFIGLALVCYYAAGAAMLVFALTCAIADLFSSSRHRLVVLYALVAAGLPYVVGVAVFGLEVHAAYTDLSPVSWKLLHFPARRRGVEAVYVLYGLAPAAMMIGGLVSTLWARHRQVRRARDARVVAAGTLRPLANAVVLIAVGAAVAWGSLDGAQKTHFAVDYFAYHHRWPDVIAEARRDPDDPFVMHAVNRALYHTGQLGDSMFAWPQKPAYLFLAGADYPWAYWQSFATHLELGYVNLAENALMECLAGMGERPMILQQLAMVNMVKGNPDTARVYLHRLSATLTHRAWAQRYLQLLDRDRDLATDADVQRLRSIALERDFPSLGLSPEALLSCLLERNPTNRMAFEYLMAWYLSNRQLTRFVKRLDDLHDQGFAALPRHYEEAIMVYTAMAGTTIQLPGYEPRDEVRRQMEHFLGILRRHGGNRQAALAELATQHGDSYAFYNVYGPREERR